MHNVLKKYLNVAFLLSFVAVLSISILFTSCKKDDDLDVKLYSFGPTPVLRGNDIKFLGENLHLVTSVILPDNIEITEINITSNSEISITVPQEAETGHVVLNYKGGSITTKSTIGFTEPFEITSISPTGSPIREGDEVAISGDYLNNIVKVVFSGDAPVDSTGFVSQGRKEIKVNVPKEAVSGKIYIADASGNQLYSDQELTILQPSVSSLSPTEIKAGEDLTISGDNLDLVTEITFTGGPSVVADSFLSASATSIKLATPAGIQDGAITLTAYSGVEVTSSQSLTTVVPSGISVTAESRYKTGLNIIISGSDLDLVSSILFAGSANGITDFTYSGGEITVAIPTGAIDGKIALGMLSGKNVTTDSITLVKSTITSFDPTTVIAGKDISITGTDLDLAESVVFGGDQSGEIISSGETSLTVTVPTTAESGYITLVLINGEKVISADELTVNPSTLPVITSITRCVLQGKLITIKGENLNHVETIYFEDNVKATSYGSRLDTLLEVYVPETAKIGEVTLKLISYDSEEVTSTLNIYEFDPLTASSIIIMDYEAHGDHNGDWDNSWTDASATDILTEDGNTFIKVVSELKGWYMNCNHQANGAPPFEVITNVENYVIKLDVKIDEGVTGAENAQLQFVFADQWNYWYGAGLLPPASTGGEWVTISIPTSKWSLSGTLDLTSGTNGLYGDVVTMPAGVSFDNLRFDPK